MRTLLFLLAWAAPGLVLAQAEPVTYHVRPDGDDAAGGTTADEAFATIARGIAALSPGDTLYLGDGVYREPDLVVEGLRATAERPTVIKSVNRWGAKVEGVVYHTVLFKILDCAHLVLDGLEVYHPGDTYDTDWATGIETFGSDFVTVRNCYAHDCGCGGFGGRTGDYLTFEDNVAVGNAMTSPYNCSGISIYHPRQLDDAPGPHIVVRDNVVFGNACPLPFSIMGFTVPTDGNGIILDDYANDQPAVDPDGSANPPFTALTLVEGNLAFGNGGAGLKVFKVSNAIFRNNTAYHNNYILGHYSGSRAEIGFEDATGHIEVYDNIAVQAFGRAGNAFYYKPQGTAEGDAARLTAKRNLFIGSTEVRGARLSARANTLLAEDEQAYAGFADARDTVALFASADELRHYFFLREGSAAAGLGAFDTVVAIDAPLPPDPKLTAEIELTPAPLEVDGRREGFYTAAPRSLTKMISGTAPEPADLSARWWGAYDTSALYVFVEVVDDEVTAGDEAVLFLGAADGRVVRAAPDARVSTGTGYAAEWRVSRERLAAGGRVVALDLGVVDADGEDANATVAWSASGIAEFGRSAGLGRGELTAVVPPPAVHRVAAAPTIDGVREAVWSTAPPHRLGIVITPTVEDSLDAFATWRALYDEKAIYFLVEVTDDSLAADSDVFWKDDGVEIYLDADNAKAFASYDDNDYQLTVGIDGALTAQKGELGGGTQAAVARREGGYVAEVAIPWAAIGVAPAPGTFLGLDVHLNDDDDGGPLDGKLSWFAELNRSFANAALFGTVYLGRSAGE